MAAPVELSCPDVASWRAWLAAHHADTREVWLVFAKKHTGRAGLSYDEAVEEALCVGWVDSLVRRLDDDRYARKFTPRVDPTRWSAANLERVERLVAAGRMTAAGLRVLAPGVTPLPAVSARPLEPPPFVAAALAAQPAAAARFAALSPSRRRDLIAWVCSARRDATRQRRLAELVACLAAGRELGLK